MVGPCLRLTQAPNIAIATLWADLLCEAGMTASVQRQYLGAPPDTCRPTVFARNLAQYDEHATRARALPQDLQDLPQRRWHCRCGEMVEGGFEQCWQCGALMPRE